LTFEFDSRKSLCLILISLSVFISLSSVKYENLFAYSTRYSNKYNVLRGTPGSECLLGDVQTVDSDLLVIQSEAKKATTPACHLECLPKGRTNLLSGDILKLASEDSAYMTFRSYITGTDISDFVDNNVSDIDSSGDKGIHSNFTAQLYGPDSIFDTLVEENTGVASNTTLVNAESFEGTWPPSGWTETGAWSNETDQAYDGVCSADFDGSFTTSSGDLDTPDLNCSDANAIYVDFWYRDDDLDFDDFLLLYYDGDSWDIIADLGSTGQEGQWLHYQEKVTDNQYFVSTFKVRWSGVSVYYGESAWVDYVTIKKEVMPAIYELDLEVQWTNVNGNLSTAELCIFGGAMGSENIQVDVWNGSAWENLFDKIASGWNNVSVSSYLESTFTIRYKDSIKMGDTSPDSWNIDVAILHILANLNGQPFDWTVAFLYILPVIAIILVLLILIYKRKKKKNEVTIEKKTDPFSTSFGITHQWMTGKKMLLEIDPTSNYQEALFDFTSEAKNNGEELFIFTSANSPLRSASERTKNAKFFLLASEASSPKQMNDTETILPVSDLSLLLNEFSRIQKTSTKKPKAILFDNLSDIMLLCGFEKTYKFIRWLLETLSSSRTTTLFVFNPTAHDQRKSSSIRGLFQIRLAYAKSGPKTGTL